MIYSLKILELVKNVIVFKQFTKNTKVFNCAYPYVTGDQTDTNLGTRVFLLKAICRL